MTDEESRMFMKMYRARFFSQFILNGQSKILRCVEGDREGLRLTAVKHFSVACTAADHDELWENLKEDRSGNGREPADRFGDCAGSG